MGKITVKGIQVPITADSLELRGFVEMVFQNCGESYTIAGAELRVNPATVWKLKHGRQKDSPRVREEWDILPRIALAPVCPIHGVVHVRHTCPRTHVNRKPRPRVSISTVNPENAAKSIIRKMNPQVVMKLIDELESML